MRRSLTKLNFLTKLIKIFNICCFLGDVPKYISERKLTSKYFCDNFLKQSKVQLLTRPRPGVSHLCWVQVQKKLSRLTRLFCNCRAGKIKLCFQCFQCFKFFYPNASNESLLPLNSLKRIDGSILSQNYSEISWIYLFGNTNFNSSVKHYYPKCHYYQILTETAIIKTAFNNVVLRY